MPSATHITVVAMKRLPPISAVIPKIRSIATEPAYSTSGSMVNNISDKKMNDTMTRLRGQSGISRNSGIVEMPSLKYFGMKNSAISVNAIGHMVSQPIAVMPAA